jgi:hypothetical protein
MDPLIDEAAFLYAWLTALRKRVTAPRALGLALHANFLGFDLIARISVQQTDQVGFDQFEKFTNVGVRESLEARYENRFRQLNRRKPHRMLHHLEGRLAAKGTVDKQVEIIRRIARGYLDFRGCPHRKRASGTHMPLPPCLTGGCNGGACQGPVSGRPDGELSLVVHFIKRLHTQKRVRTRCRDLELRLDLEVQARNVLAACRTDRIARAMVSGIDGAGNELHAAPEVFSATYRMMRVGGIDRATYHAGEDFHHIVGGIRATAEAREFLDLGSGDRIGHATALGLSPQLWIDRLGDRIMARAGDHLDDLVFAYIGLIECGHPAAARWLDPIARISGGIFEESVAPETLHQAWRLRILDPLLVLELERKYGLKPGDSSIADRAQERAETSNVSDTRRELKMISEAVRAHPEAYRIFRLRHERPVTSEPLTEIETAWIKPDEITALQNRELQAMQDAGVTLETLPTSNLRISVYTQFAEHHLFRWLGLTEDKLDFRPTVCVGSDDTGIFATNLFNEYASILLALVGVHGLPRDEVAARIAALNANGFMNRFRS